MSTTTNLTLVLHGKKDLRLEENNAPKPVGEKGKYEALQGKPKSKPNNRDLR